MLPPKGVEIPTFSSSEPSAEGYDAIFVLGGGLLPKGEVPPWVVRRLEGALQLHQNSKRRSGKQRGTPIVLLGAGTPHKPPVITPDGLVLHEATAYAEYLLQREVNALDLYKECQSYDTVGNAYFSLTMHAMPACWRRLAIVTSEFHIYRTEAVFSSTYELAEKSFALSRQIKPQREETIEASIASNGVEHPNNGHEPLKFDLTFFPVSDEDLFSSEVLEARAIKEREAVQRWRKDVASFRSLADMHAWLYATHLCYSVSRQHEFGLISDLDSKLAATY